MKSKIDNKEIFVDIIRQVQLPAVQVMIRTREDEETLESKTYQDIPQGNTSQYKQTVKNQGSIYLFCFT